MTIEAFSILSTMRIRGISEIPDENIINGGDTPSGGGGSDDGGNE